MSKILIIAPGAYGDTFPLFPIAQALRVFGHQITIVCNSRHSKICQGLGFEFIELDEPVENRLGFGNIPTSIINEILLITAANRITNQISCLLPISAKFDIMIGNQLATGAAMVAKSLGIPWVFCAASPLAIPSHDSPPLLPYFHGLQRRFPSQNLSRSCLRLTYGISRLFVNPLLKIQRQLGIPDAGHPLFEGRYSRDLNLLMVSSALVKPAADWPNNTHISGFTWFSPDHMRTPSKSSRLKHFIESGEAPIVFTLGGPRRSSPGDFFVHSLAACRLMGKRAVFVAAQSLHEKIPRDDNTLVTSYLPFHDIFPHALAVVHSGGIGTIALGMRYAVPALFCPSGVDQYDNAWRATQLGLGHEIRIKNYTSGNIAMALKNLINDQACRDNLNKYSRILANENGALTAAERIRSTFNL